MASSSIGNMVFDMNSEQSITSAIEPKASAQLFHSPRIVAVDIL